MQLDRRQKWRLDGKGRFVHKSSSRSGRCGPQREDCPGPGGGAVRLWRFRQDKQDCLFGHLRYSSGTIQAKNILIHFSQDLETQNTSPRQYLNI